MEYRIREGVRSDLPYLERMLRQAANWSGCEETDVDEIMSRPEISVILMDWGRPGDTAVIAELKNGQPAGAAWYRFYTKESHSYGFVDEETAEIAIAVEEAYRNRGIGKSLLECLIREATKQNVRKLSLSVDSSNYAARMYERAGFANIDDESDDHWTMVLNLA